MKAYLLIIAIFLYSTQFSFSQEDGVVSLAIPVRSSLKFNRYLTQPTFSFVREQNTYINITNKREWVQFENAPQTYLINYTGRYSENIGVGIGLFQQNYGVLTTFGGILNFAYNARLQADSNLTFGLNLGFYKSNINEGNVVINQADPSLDNIPKNMVLSVSPGINYGLVFFDFGLSVNNLVQYNIKTSELIKEDPQQSIQAHVMYTGYMYSRGFFDESKFSALLRSEFKKDQTIFSGIAMLTVPKGIWAQVGYNTVYGFTGGVGLNVTKQISVEYNYEKAMGDLATFGSSHEFTLAYKFQTRNRYHYSGDDREEALLIKDQKRKPAVSNKPVLSSEERAQLAEQKAMERAAAQEEARLAAEARALERAEAKERARLEGEAKAQALAEAQAAAQATNTDATQAQAEKEAEEQARLAAEQAAQLEAEEQARLAAEQAAQQKAEEQARLAAERAAQLEAEEQARLAAERAAQLEAERAAQLEAEEQARLAAEQAAQLEAEEQARLAAEQAAQLEAEEQARLAAEQAAQLEAEEQARLAAEQAAQLEAEEQARFAAEQAVQLEAEEQARLAAEQAAQANLEIAQKDDLAKSMYALTEETKEDKAKQEELLIRLNEVLIIKEKDLKDLKEENDLSEQGIYMEPKPFKSITAENRAMEAIKSELEATINKRNQTISELENLYNQRIKKGSNRNDATSQYYLETIQNLKAEQVESERMRASIVSTLETVKVATEVERKRRIKRALYDNEKDRFNKDMAALERIKQNTPLSPVPLSVEDFNFGEEQSGNVQILKGVQNVDNGYYMIIAVHENINDRDEFLEKVVASGQSDVNFFFDVNSSKYYIYYQKFDYVEEAMRALDSKGNKPYNEKMSVVKIED
ncbi:PorP/SprF family type IX secretion system membrane protein [Xanthomarina gelatinilytica]|uniref:PorP/SprF family type IX secretion system membrane protein n=1 Tax=Xanthomarina gelatinilytica TaxID=1137281 RepID=UPI003AA8193F